MPFEWIANQVPTPCGRLRQQIPPFSNICLRYARWLCHTLCMTGRYGVSVTGLVHRFVPRYGGLLHPISLLPPIKSQVNYYRYVNWSLHLHIAYITFALQLFKTCMPIGVMPT